MLRFLNRKVQRISAAVLGSFLLYAHCSSAWAIDDPGVAGPLTANSQKYQGSDISLPGFPGPVEVLAKVWYPTKMTTAYPLVIFLHGKHDTCYQGSSSGSAYPCPPGYKSIPSYLGYDYLASSLAANGYIVVSISANGINAKDNSQLVSDGGALARAQLIQDHLDIWRSFNNGGDPFGGRVRGRVDLTRVGTMGHSRGGEGVVKHFLYNASLGSPYGIKAVLPLAPVNFSRSVINGVPLGVLLPYCDGDVSNLQGIHYYDDARYNVASDAAPKHTFLVMGANHNFYNTVWNPDLFPAGGADDWFYPENQGASTDPYCSSFGSGKRLTAKQQLGTARAYIMAFVLAYLGNRTDLLPYLKAQVPPPPSAQTSLIYPSYHPATSQRLDINRLLTSTNLTTNTLGGSVSRSGVLSYTLCGGVSPQPVRCLPSAQDFRREPHVVDPSVSTKRGLSQLKIGWTTPSALYTNAIPNGYGNVSSFTNLQFRAAINFTSPYNVNSLPQDLSVVLTDTSGRLARVRVGAYSPVLSYPPGGGIAPTPKVVLNTVRIPLSAFQALGVNLASISTVKFEFNKTGTGELLISDLAFAK